MLRLFFLFLFILIRVHGQTDYLAGEIQLNNGTKIKGEIAYNGWVKTPAEITFKVSETITTYKPEELSSFVVGIDKYLSKELEINITQQDFQNLSESIRSKVEKRHVFLRVLVEGTASLYSYKDSRTHFFASKEEEFIELIKLKRSSNSTTSSYNKYLGQLNLLLSDCNNDLKLATTQFTTSNLMNKINSYNKCVSAKSTYLAKKSPLELGLHAIGGYRTSSFDISDNEFYDNYVIDKSSTNNFVFGFAAIFNVLRNTNRLQLYNELVYQGYKFDASFSEIESEDFFTNYTLNLDVGYLELSNILRYQLNARNNSFNPFISMGVTNSFRVSDSSEEMSETVFFDTTRTTIRDPFEGRILSYRVFFSLGLGANFKRFSVEIRYGFNPKFSDFPVIGKSQNINFLLGYRFF